MRHFVGGLLACAIALPACMALARPASAQATTQPAGESGTLQVPAKHTRDQPVKPPLAAPRTPVHQEGRHESQKPRDTQKHEIEKQDARKRDTGKHEKKASKPPPVVPPHGPLHPKKPPGTKATSASAPAVVPTPVPPAPPPAAVQAPAPAQAQPAQASAAADATQAPKLPRFASLRSDDVNMRAGPGTRYRIEWVYRREALPVEIEREFDVWRWVRDPDNIQGWVNKATMIDRRTFIVAKADATMRTTASDTASPVAVLKPGVVGRIRSCEAGAAWCEVQTGSYRGFLRRDQFWGTFPGEKVP